MLPWRKGVSNHQFRYPAARDSVQDPRTVFASRKKRAGDVENTRAMKTSPAIPSDSAKPPPLIRPRLLEVDFEVAPQRCDLTLFLHLIDNTVGVLAAFLRAPFFTLDKFFGRGVTFSLEPVENPLVEVEAPVEEGVRFGCVGFAETVGRRGLVKRYG